MSGALEMAYVAWQSVVSQTYRAWVAREGTDPTAQDLIDARCLFYGFRLSGGTPIPLIVGGYDATSPGGVAGIQLESGVLTTFTQLNQPTSFALSTSDDITKGGPAPRDGSRRWDLSRPACYTSHLHLLMQSFARIHGRLPESHDELLHEFHLVPIDFAPTTEVPVSPVVGAIVRWNPADSAVWFDRVPGAPGSEEKIWYYHFDPGKGDISFEKRPLIDVPEARNWPIFVVAQLPTELPR